MLSNFIFVDMEKEFEGIANPRSEEWMGEGGDEISTMANFYKALGLFFLFYLFIYLFKWYVIILSNSDNLTLKTFKKELLKLYQKHQNRGTHVIHNYHYLRAIRKNKKMFCILIKIK